MEDLHMSEQPEAAGFPRKRCIGPMIEISVRGSWKEMGRQYGTLLKDEILHDYEYAKCKATHDSDAFLLPSGLPLGIDFLDDLFCGVAESTGLTLAQLVTLNGIEVAYMGELMNELGPSGSGKCAGLAIFGHKTTDGRVIYGRNYDWLPSFANLPMVLARFIPDDGSQELAMINYAGCLYMATGMNQSGLFVELNSGCFATAAQNNSVPQNAWYLWQVLKDAKNSPEAAHMLESCPARNVYIIGIADPNQVLVYEWDVAKPMTVSPDMACCTVAMTNHFIRPTWTNLPAAADGGTRSSISRRQALQRLAGNIPDGTGDLDAMKQIFDVTTEEGGAKWPGTLYQTIADPANRTIYVRHAHDAAWFPCRMGSR